MRSSKLLKVTSSLIALVIVFSLAACGGNSDSGTTSDTPAGTTSSDTTQDTQTTPQATVAPLETEVVDESLSLLPIVTTPITFTIWGSLEAATASQYAFEHETEYFKQLEADTGVSIRFVHPPTGGEQENLNLLIASDEYPDALQITPLNYPGGFSKAIQDGFMLDIKDLVKEYAPYYWNLLNQSEEHRRQAFTDEGYLAGFHQVSISQPPWIGLTTRQDWLDELNIPTPVTYADWESALTQFKNEKGADAPFMISNNGFQLFDVFQAGYGFAPGFYQIDKKVQYGPLSPGFKDYVEMMQRWYANGLLDPDFAAAWYFTHPYEYTTTGRTGLWQDVYVSFPSVTAVAQAQDPDFHCVAVPTPVQNNGDTVHIHQKNNLIQGGIYVLTDNCTDPVTFTKWMNYVYSPEGTIRANYGIEGDTFVYDENGEPKFTEKMYANPDGLSLAEAIRKYTKGPVGGFNYDWRRELTPGMNEDVLNALSIWDSNVDYAYLLPPITLNAEEGAENARIMNEVNTYRDEMVVKFIMGTEPLSNYDAFIDTINNLGINRAIELQQAALDRYYAR